MGNFNDKLDRKEKIKLLNQIYNNGYNPVLFKKPKMYVFIQDLSDRNLFKMEDKYYTEEEMNIFEKDNNLINMYLNEKHNIRYEELNKVLIVWYKDGKSTL